MTQLLIGPTLVAQDLVLRGKVDPIVDAVAGDVATGFDADVFRPVDRAAPERPAAAVEDHAVGRGDGRAHRATARFIQDSR